MKPQLERTYGAGLQLKEFLATDIAAINVSKRQLQKAYMEYWNSTASLTSTGRPVDAIIAPAAPFPAARPDQYGYYGYSLFVNALDYTSVILPVTQVDKEVDVKVKDYKPLSEVDKDVYDSCEYFLLSSAFS